VLLSYKTGSDLLQRPSKEALAHDHGGYHAKSSKAKLILKQNASFWADEIDPLSGFKISPPESYQSGLAAP